MTPKTENLFYYSPIIRLTEPENKYVTHIVLNTINTFYISDRDNTSSVIETNQEIT